MSDAIQRIREALAWSARAFGDHSDDIRALLDRLDAAVREIERLRHDIERHIAIASEHATECERLRAELSAYREDAERYRWLRNRIPGSAYRIAGIIYSEGGVGVDAGIDKARKGEGE